MGYGLEVTEGGASGLGRQCFIPENNKCIAPELEYGAVAQSSECILSGSPSRVKQCAYPHPVPELVEVFLGRVGDGGLV